MDWTKLIQHCDVLEELTDIEKEQAKRAFQFLRRELGEDFLSSEPSHPFVRNVVNTAPWTRNWIIRFSEALKELKVALQNSVVWSKKGFAHKLVSPQKQGMRQDEPPRAILSERSVPDEGQSQ